MEKTFQGLTVRKALNGYGFDYKDHRGNWCVYMTSSLSKLESDELEALLL